MRTARLSLSHHFARLVTLVVMAAMALQAPLARDEIVATETLATQSQAEQDRAKVQAFVERANVKERLEAMGLSGLVAQDRVAALSEAEVHALAQRIDAMPAGGNLSNQDLIIILLVAILVALAI